MVLFPKEEMEGKQFLVKKTKLWGVQGVVWKNTKLLWNIFLQPSFSNDYQYGKDMNMRKIST